MLKIVITDAETVGEDIHFGCFAEFGRVVRYDLTSPSKITERIRDADIILCNKTLLTRENMSEAHSLKYIGLFATGYNNIDLDYARSRGIVVSNAPGYSTESVVQHTFALILELFSRVGEYNELVKSGGWIKSRTFSLFPLPTAELSGKVIGIIGYGAIGRRVAKVARAFGMKPVVYTRTPVTDAETEFTSLEALLEQSDIVTLHCPLNSDSEKMINKQTLALMKKDAVLINTARGAVVDEGAVADALKNGRLAGFATDVLSSEPMRSDCPLYKVEKCIITPHTAWASPEARQRLIEVVVSNLRGYLHGTPLNQVI